VPSNQNVIFCNYGRFEAQIAHCARSQKMFFTVKQHIDHTFYY